MYISRHIGNTEEFIIFPEARIIQIREDTNNFFLVVGPLRLEITDTQIKCKPPIVTTNPLLSYFVVYVNKKYNTT